MSRAEEAENVSRKTCVASARNIFLQTAIDCNRNCVVFRTDSSPDARYSLMVLPQPASKTTSGMNRSAPRRDCVRPFSEIPTPAFVDTPTDDLTSSFRFNSLPSIGMKGNHFVRINDFRSAKLKSLISMPSCQTAVLPGTAAFVIPLQRFQTRFTLKGNSNAKVLFSVGGGSKSTCVCEAPRNPVSPDSHEGKTISHPLSSKYPHRRQTRVKRLVPRHFINLTNGVEILAHLGSLVHTEELRFTRIQSSLCEQGAYDKILSLLDNELLFSLATGRDCYIYDLASRAKIRGVPRSLFLGVEFIKWSLAYLWFGSDGDIALPSCVLVRGKNPVPFWRDELLPYKISKDTKKRIRYYSSFANELGVREIRLHGVYGRISEYDGCKGIHVKLVRDWLEIQSQELEEGCNEDSYSEMESWMRKYGYVVHDWKRSTDELIAIQDWISAINNTE